MYVKVRSCSALCRRRPGFACARGVACDTLACLIAPSHGLLLPEEPLPLCSSPFAALCVTLPLFVYVSVGGLSWRHARGLATSILQAKTARREKPEWLIERELDQVRIFPPQPCAVAPVDKSHGISSHTTRYQELYLYIHTTRLHELAAPPRNQSCVPSGHSSGKQTKDPSTQCRQPETSSHCSSSSKPPHVPHGPCRSSTPELSSPFLGATRRSQAA